MSSSRGLKWALLLVVLVVSLGWKLVVRPGNSSEADGKAFQVRIADFLNRQRLTVSIAARFEEGQPVIRASAGSCRVLVVRSPAIGWDRDLIRGHSTPDDDVFVVYRGVIYREQPRFRTAIDFLWARLWRELGMGSQASPVVAVIASKACNAMDMPWGEVV